MAAKKFIVELDAQERERLNALTSKGKAPAKTVLKARILLKADQAEGGPGWLDAQIVEALDTNLTMVSRVREKLVTEGAPPSASRPRLPRRLFERLRRKHKWNKSGRLPRALRIAAGRDRVHGPAGAAAPAPSRDILAMICGYFSMLRHQGCGGARVGGHVRSVAILRLPRGSLMIGWSAPFRASAPGHDGEG